MQHRLEIAAAFASTLFLSVAFGALPALSSVLTSPDEFGFGPTQYGVLFLPQAVGAILASLAGAVVARRVRPKTLVLAGVVAALGAFAIRVHSSPAVSVPPRSPR